MLHQQQFSSLEIKEHEQVGSPPIPRKYALSMKGKDFNILEFRPLMSFSFLVVAFTPFSFKEKDYAGNFTISLYNSHFP